MVIRKILLLVILFFVLSSGVKGKDRSYIRVQSTQYPITQNLPIILSPFLDRIKHEVIDSLRITITKEESQNVNPTEIILKRLMEQARLMGANAIAKLQIGSYVVYEHSDFDDTTRRIHRLYGWALAIKILPAKKGK